MEFDSESATAPIAMLESELYLGMAVTGAVHSSNFGFAGNSSHLGFDFEDSSSTTRSQLSRPHVFLPVCQTRIGISLACRSVAFGCRVGWIWGRLCRSYAGSLSDLATPVNLHLGVWVHPRSKLSSRQPSLSACLWHFVISLSYLEPLLLPHLHHLFEYPLQPELDRYLAPPSRILSATVASTASVSSTWFDQHLQFIIDHPEPWVNYHSNQDHYSESTRTSQTATNSIISSTFLQLSVILISSDLHNICQNHWT